MARRSAGTGARTPTGTPPGVRPAAPCRSGPAPAQPPWRPSAGTATTTDGPSPTGVGKGVRCRVTVGAAGTAAPGGGEHRRARGQAREVGPAPGPGRDLLPGPRRDRLAGPAGRLPAAPDRLRPVPTVDPRAGVVPDLRSAA